MSIHPELVPAYVGTGTTVSGAIVGFCVAVTPVLQVLTLLMTFIVGALTAVWTWKKIRAHNKGEGRGERF